MSRPLMQWHGVLRANGVGWVLFFCVVAILQLSAMPALQAQGDDSIGQPRESTRMLAKEITFTQSIAQYLRAFLGSLIAQVPAGVACTDTEDCGANALCLNGNCTTSVLPIQGANVCLPCPDPDSAFQTNFGCPEESPQYSWYYNNPDMPDRADSGVDYCYCTSDAGGGFISDDGGDYAIGFQCNAPGNIDPEVCETVTVTEELADPDGTATLEDFSLECPEGFVLQDSTLTQGGGSTMAAAFLTCVTAACGGVSQCPQTKITTDKFEEKQGTGEKTCTFIFNPTPCNGPAVTNPDALRQQAINNAKDDCLSKLSPAFDCGSAALSEPSCEGDCSVVGESATSAAVQKDNAGEASVRIGGQDSSKFLATVNCWYECVQETQCVEEEVEEGPVCGNGTKEDGEECDGDDLGGAQCSDYEFSHGDDISCYPPGDEWGCRINTDNCFACGDGIRQGEEECDGEDLNDQTCASILEDETAVGTLACVPTSDIIFPCTFNPVNCSLCGDGRKEGDEECDEGDANSDEPNAACRKDCSLPTCGDGIVDDATGEECDGTPSSDNFTCNDECKEICNPPSTTGESTFFRGENYVYAWIYPTIDTLEVQQQKKRDAWDAAKARAKDFSCDAQRVRSGVCGEGCFPDGESIEMVNVTDDENCSGLLVPVYGGSLRYSVICRAACEKRQACIKEEEVVTCANQENVPLPVLQDNPTSVRGCVITGSDLEPGTAGAAGEHCRNLINNPEYEVPDGYAVEVRGAGVDTVISADNEDLLNPYICGPGCSVEDAIVTGFDTPDAERIMYDLGGGSFELHVWEPALATVRCGPSSP